MWVARSIRRRALHNSRTTRSRLGGRRRSCPNIPPRSLERNSDFRKLKSRRCSSQEQFRMSAPLDGINVLDLSWVMVGPASGRYLADMGADVIKVESSKRIDPVRTLGPFKDGKTGPERSVSYHNLNAGKRCIAVDIRRPEGREDILRLAKWADVVLESFTPGVLETLHLGYLDLKQCN